VYVSPRIAVVALALCAAAAFLPFDVILDVSIALVALTILVAVDVWLAPPPVRLGVARSLPEVMQMGREEHLSLALRNPTDRSLSVVVRDATPPSAARVPRVASTTLGPRSLAVLDGVIAPGRRGWLHLGPITVRAAGPLRLAGRQRTLPIVDRVRVYPALPGRAEVSLWLDRARVLQAGERSAAFRGGGTDLDSLREYHPDDEFRRINWRATARVGKAITNVYREERNQQVMLLLDASRVMAGSIAGVPRFEHTLDAAIAVAELATRIGDRVGMLAFGSSVVAALPARGGHAQPRRILETLFALEPSLDAPAYRTAFAALVSRTRRRSLLVLFTELTEESAMEPLFDALPVVLARHLLIVGSVTDPDVVSLRDTDPGSSDDVYLSAAAAASLAARERAAGHLRGAGAVVEDREPGRLAGAVADRYLRFKGAGTL
jgi:uncharacterized protein (DUF58 family)